ncbi:hypothetical protein BCR33DRAFT_728460 [Rhizoclosmatium globosum]|uniref:G-protein coupled receptors family 3 profile domain-containing protein n=1 Tax=Rhizoclosmatium globosum TaxID=329046 RepID=A0A1Y2ALF1_9FUNG|nr:hypothetical protein BCR33DRAFT_728460 [Rhizoclosmatium globosum]|eukprot:ORY22775.1 hypothetical protein BCR33DRAFT_728460 [Rhizoclosmatium globosum]
MVIKRYDMSGSTILFKKALSLMDRSTGFAMSPYESDTFKIAENNSVMVDTSQQSGVIVGNYPYTITYLSPIDALAQNADMASIQHINGDFIPCTTETLSNSINSIDFESANSLNPYTDFAVAIDVPIKEAYPLTIVVNYLINPSNISADYTTAVHTLKFLWWFLINPTYATETLFIPLFNTALGNKTLSFLSNVQFQDKGRLFGRSICDPTLSEAWTFKNPCVHGQCAHSLPFQEASVTCICDFGYENYLFSDCREPTALFRRDWPSIVEYSLFGIGGLVCLTIAANRGQDSIKNIAPNCCLFITFGCFAGNLSILFQAASATKYSCALITVVPAFAFGAIFG